MNYRDRLYKLIEYIDANLEEDLTIEKLSEFACLSKHHFHRQFSSLFGITAFTYIKQARMKRASYQLAFKKDERIIDIAFSSGYQSPEAFSRAFSQTIGQSPSQFRDQPNWTLWDEKHQKLKQQHTDIEVLPRDVKIIKFSDVKVAAIDHFGSLNLIGNTINKLFSWCAENGISFEGGNFFNIVNVCEPDEFYCEICISINNRVEHNSYGVTEKIIPGGRCALIRHIGSDESMSHTISYLYTHWLQNSDEILRDSPLFIKRVSLMPDVPEAEIVSDIYLPLMNKSY